MRHTQPISARLAARSPRWSSVRCALSPLTARRPGCFRGRRDRRRRPPAAEPASARRRRRWRRADAAKETVDNPYGLGALWEQGDFVARGTLIILVHHEHGQLVHPDHQAVREPEAELARPRRAQRTFFKSRVAAATAPRRSKTGSAFRFIADSGIEASEHHEGALTENIDRNTWVSMSVQRSVDDVQSRLQDGLAFLATVGSTAPFVGLFGTVWGIYHALTAIGIAGQASIDKVAGPVGEALIMTAIGLAVAVPAVLGYNWLVRRNKVDDGAVRALRRRPARRPDGRAPARRGRDAADAGSTPWR